MKMFLALKWFALFVSRCLSLEAGLVSFCDVYGRLHIAWRGIRRGDLCCEQIPLRNDSRRCGHRGEGEE
jgi:hypothetical protein